MLKLLLSMRESLASLTSDAILYSILQCKLIEIGAKEIMINVMFVMKDKLSLISYTIVIMPRKYRV